MELYKFMLAHRQLRYIQVFEIFWDSGLARMEQRVISHKAL